MTTTAVTPPMSESTPQAPRRRPRVRHGILAAALAAVAALRAGQGDWWWAAVLATGAAAEVAVLLLERRRTARSAGAGASGAPGPRPGEATLVTSLGAHRRATRTWTALTGVALVAAAGLLMGDPALAAVVAGIGIVALVLRRRSQRTCARIERLLGTAGDGAP